MKYVVSTFSRETEWKRGTVNLREIKTGVTGRKKQRDRKRRVGSETLHYPPGANPS